MSACEVAIWGDAAFHLAMTVILLAIVIRLPRESVASRAVKTFAAFCSLFLGATALHYGRTETWILVQSIWRALMIVNFSMVIAVSMRRKN